MNASNTTYAGLVGRVRSPGPDDGWHVLCGPLLADSTDYLAVQYPENLDERVIDCLKEGLGSGPVTIMKKGYQDSIPLVASVLLVGTPSQGDWEQFVPVVEQIPIEPSLRSQLDLTVLNTDGRQEFVGAKPVEPSAAREYVARARELSPGVSGHVGDRLFEGAVEVHVENLDQETVPQQALDTLRRLAEASARARYADRVALDDARRAVRLYRRPYEVQYDIN